MASGGKRGWSSCFLWAPRGAIASRAANQQPARRARNRTRADPGFYTPLEVKVLIIDDNPDLVEALRLGFQVQWRQCQVVVAENGQKALELFSRENPDLILLDILMPGMDGFQVLRCIREVSDVPVIILTVKDEEMDKIRALELGADDYVTKPFGSLELVGRMKTVLRRAGSQAPNISGPYFTCGDLTVERASRTVSAPGRSVKLGPTEYRLLCALARRPNEVLSCQALTDEVWGSKRPAGSKVKVYVKRLRSKIEDDPSKPQRIITEWGRGYKLAIP